MKNAVECEKNKAIDKLKNLFEKVYGEGIFVSRFSKLKNNELIERAKQLRDGVPFATPVFDGAKELDINQFFDLHQVIQVVRKSFNRRKNR